MGNINEVVTGNPDAYHTC